MRRALHDRSFELAVTLARRVLKFAPNDNGAWARLAQAQFGAGDLSGLRQTLADWERAVTRTSAKYHEYRGDLALADGHRADALAAWKESVARKDRKARVFIKIARLEQADGHWPEAATAWTRGLKSNRPPLRWLTARSVTGIYTAGRLHSPICIAQSTSRRKTHSLGNKPLFSTGSGNFSPKCVSWTRNWPPCLTTRNYWPTAHCFSSAPKTPRWRSMMPRKRRGSRRRRCARSCSARWRSRRSAAPRSRPGRRCIARSASRRSRLNSCKRSDASMRRLSPSLEARICARIARGS